MEDANMMSLMGVIGMLLIIMTSFIYYETNWQNNIYIALLGGTLNILSVVWFIGLLLCSFKHKEVTNK